MRGLAEVVAAASPERVGTVTAVRGLALEVAGLPCAVGDHVEVAADSGAATRAEVVSSARGVLTCMPMGPLAGMRVGQPARAVRGGHRVPTGPALLGRVLDALGRPIDGRGPLVAPTVRAADRAPAAMERARIDTPLPTGIRALDTLVTLGRGQRIGLFAGSGVGKSSLLSMVARGSEAQVCVIALVGERGREVREFLEDDLGAEGLARSVVVVATSDEPALVRLRAADTATSIAESFRADGAHALLMMDSLTRVAMAQREIGLSAGEAPATRGYPPSAFAVLARLLERAGTARTGSVTGIYTVLVDGDDHNEPVADTARSILDGHVVLDRRLAVMGHYPPIDVLGSISRVATKVNPAERTAAATALRRVLAARKAAQDLIDVGAYTRGANPLVDAALDHATPIEAFLTQGLDERTTAADAWAALTRLTTNLGVSR